MKRFTSKSIKQADIVDLGVTRERLQPRFALCPLLRDAIFVVVKKLQKTVILIASEIPCCRDNRWWYSTNPAGDLLLTPGGAALLPELLRHWEVLRKHIERRGKYVLKYIKEAHSEEVTSLASTAPEVYQAFKESTALNHRLREYAALIPAHAHNGLDHLLQELFSLDGALLEAFPECDIKQDPTPISYNPATSEREDLAYVARTSHSGESFQLLHAQQPPSGPRNKGKNKMTM